MSRRNLSKVIFIGDSFVGKTSILEAFVDDKIRNTYKATIGADFYEKEVVADGKSITLELWDTAGQERFKGLGRGFYRGADCCVIVYDITRKQTFEHCENWIENFLQEGNPSDSDNFPFVLIGNKVDKEEEREVSDQELSEFLQKHPKITHFTLSSRNLEMVNEGFTKIALASVEHKKEEIFIPVAVTSGRIKLGQKKEKKGNRKVCC